MASDWDGYFQEMDSFGGGGRVDFANQSFLECLGIASSINEIPSCRKS